LALAAPAYSQSTILDTITVDVSSPEVKQGTAPLTAGGRYTLVVTGTARSSDTEALYDALYCFDPPSECPAEPGEVRNRGNLLEVTSGDSDTFCPIDYREVGPDCQQGIHGYVPTHRYVVSFHAPADGPLRAGGPAAVGSGHRFSGTFEIRVVGRDPDPFHELLSLDLPAPLVPADVSSPRIPRGAAALTAEVRADHGAVLEQVLTMAIRAWDARRQEVEDYIDGCVVFGSTPDLEVSPRIESRAASAALLLRACQRLALETFRADPARARAAARRCHATVAPIHRGTRPPSARRHRRMVRALQRSVRASCATPSATRMSVHVRPRGRGNTLRKLFGPRARTGYARQAPAGVADGPDATLSVSWRALRGS
jgi:hypothetical protein